MNDEQRDLARRLAAHPMFELRTGMLLLNDDTDPAHVLSVEDGSVWFAVGGKVLACKREDAVDEGDYPDLTDAATGGVLWEMAGKPLIVGVGESGFISLQGPEMPEHGGATLIFGGDTLAEACARALLAKWGEP